MLLDYISIIKSKTSVHRVYWKENQLTFVLLKLIQNLAFPFLTDIH